MIPIAIKIYLIKISFKRDGKWNGFKNTIVIIKICYKKIIRKNIQNNIQDALATIYNIMILNNHKYHSSFTFILCKTKKLNENELKMLSLSEKFQDNYHIYIYILVKNCKFKFLTEKKIEKITKFALLLSLYSKSILLAIVKSNSLSLNSRIVCFILKLTDKLSFITFIRRRLLYLFKINTVNRICEKASYEFW